MYQLLRLGFCWILNISFAYVGFPAPGVVLLKSHDTCLGLIPG